MRRALIVHPEPEIRASIESILRANGPKPMIVEWAASLADGVRRARAVQPQLIFLDIGVERSLVMEALGELQSPGRLIAALYNPLVLRGDLSFVRDFTRAGIGDYIPLPASEADILATLSASEHRNERVPAEGEIVAFFSQQGGVGTTTLAANTAVLLARDGDAPTVLCDSSVQFGSAAASLGLSPSRDLADWVSDPHGGSALSACLTEEPTSGLEVLAAPRDPLAGDRVTPENMTRVLIELRRRFARVIVDTPPVLDLVTLAVLDSADRVFVVTEAVTPTVLSTARLLRLLEDERVGEDRLRVVLNKFSTFEGNLSERTVVEQLRRDVDHVVPYDRSFTVAANRGRPFVTGRPPAAILEALAGIADDAKGRRPAGMVSR